MIKKVSIYLAIICLAESFCACNESVEYKNGYISPASCSADRCKDENILLVCDQSTGNTTDQTCTYGCDLTENRCKDKPADKCTADKCKDSDILLVCNKNTGNTTDQTCPYGCDLTENRCKDKPADKCTADKCKDENILAVCDTQSGNTTDQTCPYGCDLTENKCKDKPADKCTADKCKDNDILLVCDKVSGEYTEDTCPNGCENDACKPKDTCVPHCESDTVAIICHDDDSSETKSCTHGCDSTAGKCRINPIIGQPCRTEEDARCEDNDLIYCAETTGSAKWTLLTCPAQYQCKVNDGQAMCLETCTNEGDTTTICGSSFVLNAACSQLDGNLYYLPDYDTGIVAYCDLGCKDNHTCVEE